MRKIVFSSSLTLLLFEIAVAQRPLYTFPFGIEAYTFRRSLSTSPAKTLDTIKMMGFTEIEGAAGNISAQEYKKLCSERGINIPAIGADYKELVQHPDSIVKRAKILGSHYVMCAWIPHQDGVLTVDDAKKAVADFNKIGKLLKDNGITFCYHAHGYEFQPYQNGTLLDYIIANTNAAWVSFEMDIFWIQFGGGNPEQLLKKYGSRWKLMHLKDMRKGTKKDLTGSTSEENNVTLGTGELDMHSILKQAKKIGIKHYFIEDESSNIITQLPESISYLKSLRE
jgi:sugar phosphate isomerase/epimerase